MSLAGRTFCSIVSAVGKCWCAHAVLPSTLHQFYSLFDSKKVARMFFFVWDRAHGHTCLPAMGLHAARLDCSICRLIKHEQPVALLLLQMPLLWPTGGTANGADAIAVANLMHAPGVAYYQQILCRCCADLYGLIVAVRPPCCLILPQLPGTALSQHGLFLACPLWQSTQSTFLGVLFLVACCTALIQTHALIHDALCVSGGPLGKWH